jgi:hypothetical protein
MKTFGTLRRDSYFNPSEVLTEAEALNTAIKLLGRARFESGKDFDTTAMAAWNAFVLRWKNFYKRVTATLTGWVFRSENSTRDNLLNFEDDFNVFLGATEVTAPGSTTVIASPKPDTSRTKDSITQAVKDTADAAKEAAKGLAIPLATILGVVIVGGIAYTLWKGKHHG